MSSPPELKAPKTAFESPTFGEDSSFHVEQSIGSMSISPCGRDVALGSKEGLHLIDLDNPYSPPRYLPHRTPWEVADVQWSPFAGRDYWIITTSNQKALVWNLNLTNRPNYIEFVLHAHTRAITDINFSAHHLDILATCSIDSFIHCWDLRVPARPVLSFSDWFAGASQVKWNRQDPHVIASSHDRFLHIWDERHGAKPVRTIEAHNSKIYGLDWNRMRPEALVTCSLDRTIKFWDYSDQSDFPEKVIKTHFPVGRARHTPFGWGVCVMPQRGDNDLHLYSRTHKHDTLDTEAPPLVHRFQGHVSQVKEFLWRSRGSVDDGLDHREFQLVSWGSDKRLRLHRINSDILEGVGYEKGKSFNPVLNLTRKGAVYKTFHDEPPGPPPVVILEDTGSDDDSEEEQPTYGMGGITMPSGGWTRGGMGRIDTPRKMPLRVDVNPISWMRGVKMSSWEVETLGDEITYVGERFTRVVFEFVNISHRKVTFSLHGPWGPDQTNVFLRIDAKFPMGYPQAAAPVFSVQKTTSVSAEVAQSITSGLQAVSEAYLAKKRGCLEGCLRFLLGEYSLDEIVVMMKNQADEELKSMDLLRDGESSDDEDVGQYQGSGLDLSSSELLRPINANVMVPVPRVCSALWSNDGRLICIFPPKEEKVASFLDSIGLRDMSRLSRSKRVFETFGRFQTRSPGPKSSAAGTAASNGALTEDEISDYSDDLDDTSSSGSSDLLGTLPQQFHIYRDSHMGLSRRSNDDSQRSTGGGSMKISSSKRQNVVSIHEFTDILPTKLDFAQQYLTHGAPSEICSHNMAVAASLGNAELANIWGLLNLLLEEQLSNDLKLELQNTIQANSSNDLKRKDSGIDLAYDNDKEALKGAVTRSNRIIWGSHPFGANWFLPALFSHFEWLGDVQMLAMLSCVLSRPDADVVSDEDDQLSQALRRNPSFSTERASSPPHMQRGNSNSGGPNLSPSKDLAPASTSFGSVSTDPWPSGTPPLHSTGATPPTATRSIRPDTERKMQKIGMSVSNSPDPNTHPQHLHTPVLASSLSRSLPNEPLVGSLSGNGKKRPSPASSIGGPGNPGWANATLSGKLPSAIPEHMHSFTAPSSQVPSDTEIEALVAQGFTKTLDKASVKLKSSIRPLKDIRVEFKHQDEFDIEGFGQIPLADPERGPLYEGYRAAYADLLLSWNLPNARREILNISTPGRSTICQSDQFDSCLSTFEDKSDRKNEFIGLSLQRHCSNCGSPMTSSVFSSGEKRITPRTKQLADTPDIKCPDCKTVPQSKLSCTICGVVVDGSFAPCLLCGHLNCHLCHALWLVFEEEHRSTKTPTCRAGCGCYCPDDEKVHIPYPDCPDVSVIGEPRAPSPPKVNPRRKRNITIDFRNRSQYHPYDDPELGPNTANRHPSALLRSKSTVHIDRVHLRDATRRWRDDMAAMTMKNYR